MVQAFFDPKMCPQKRHAEFEKDPYNQGYVLLRKYSSLPATEQYRVGIKMLLVMFGTPSGTRVRDFDPNGV